MKIIMLVSNDLVTDQRVKRSCLLLQEMGYEVFVLGRILPNSPSSLHLPYKHKRFRLLFHKGPLFYLHLNIVFFIYLLFQKFDVVWANDLDTLLPSVLAVSIKKKKIVYDSHEFFTGVPELNGRPLVRNIWTWIERFSMRKLTWMITVNDAIARLYRRLYGIDVLVIRNVPIRKKEFKPKSRIELNLPLDKYILLIQGRGINIDRGVEEAIEAMQWVNNAILYIIGNGDVFAKLPSLVEKFHLHKKVRIIPTLPPDELIHYTFNADVGLSLDKPTSINYRCSLPNKFFDYLHAGLAVLASDLYELQKLINTYQVGITIISHDPRHIAEKINFMLSDHSRLERWKENARKASLELHWDVEKIKLKEKLYEYFKQ